MRIVYVNAAREWGGAEAWSADFCLGMAERGHEVTFVHHPRGELARRIARHPRLRPWPVALRGEVAPLKVLQLTRVLRNVQPDVIAVYRTRYVKPAVMANWLAGGYPLVHVHHQPSPLRDGFFYRLLWPRGVRAITVVSHEMRRLFLEHTPWLQPLTIEAIHNGIDVDRYRPHPELRAEARRDVGIADDAVVVSYHGSIEGRKRVDLIVDAIARAASEMPRLRGLIVGDGPAAEEVRAQAARLNAPIVFTGRREDIPRILAASDVALHMSIAEGFPLSVIEAMACGLPVIASEATSHPEAVEHGVTGSLVPLDADRLAGAIVRLGGSPEERARMGRAARERAAKEFNLRVMLERYETFLTRIAREASAST